MPLSTDDEFSEDSGIVWLNITQCFGHEKHLIDCPTISEQNLSQECNSLAGVKCTNQPGMSYAKLH